MVNQCVHCKRQFNGASKPLHVFDAKTLAYGGVVHTGCLGRVWPGYRNGGSFHELGTLEAAFRLVVWELLEQDPPSAVNRLALSMVWSKRKGEAWLADKGLFVAEAEAVLAKVADLRRQFEARYTLEGGLRDA